MEQEPAKSSSSLAVAGGLLYAYSSTCESQSTTEHSSTNLAQLSFESDFAAGCWEPAFLEAASNTHTTASRP